MTTYTKLRDGNWGVRLDRQIPRSEWHDLVGQQVAVRKKDGTCKTETIDRILWSGSGITLCSIIARSANRSRPAREDSFEGRRRSYKHRYGWDGVVGSASYYSSGLYDEES